MTNIKKEPKKILIVDDELDMRLFLKTLTEMNGHQPIMAKNGNEGVKKALKASPDLIVLDIMMPDEGGASTYIQLKTHKALGSIPVIILSAVPQKAFYHYLKMLHLKLGKSIKDPDAYIEKPTEPEKLSKLMETFLH